MKNLLIRYIYDNADDFLLHSIKAYEHLYSHNDTNYDNNEYAKYAILHLSSAIELYLKYKLILNDPKYIFDKINDYDIDKFQTGDFKSINLDESFNRLKQHCNVELIDYVKQDFKILKDLRNKFEHFGVVKDVDIAKNTLKKNYKHLNLFIKEYLYDDIYINNNYKKLKDKMLSLNIIFEN